MWWLVWRTVREAPQRLILAAVAVTFPVAMLAATLLFVDDSVQTMTGVALRPVQVEMRALATSLDAEVDGIVHQLQGVPGVRRIDRFGAADVIVSTAGTPNRLTARLIAVDPAYVDHHPWTHPAGDLRRGALLNAAVAAQPGFGDAPTVRIDLRGDVAPLALDVPVAGTIDTRDAAPTWFAIPAGEVQGDIALVPRVVVVDYTTFARSILPAVRHISGAGTHVLNPGLSELPPATVEAHISVDHHAYPPDPAQAASWSARLRRTLERRAPGDVIVADNAAEPLREATVDATNAKVLFLLLGIPGVLVAAALGLAAASALAEAHRRDDALLRLRGASDPQLVRLAVGQGVVAGTIGIFAGLTAAVAGVSAAVGHGAWSHVPAARLAITLAGAALAGSIVTAARLVPLVRAGRRGMLATERRRVAMGWIPIWRRSRLDVVAIAAGGFVLAGNVLAGGLRPTPVEGQALALSFYVLLAPLGLWAGVTLAVVGGLLAVLARRSAPGRPRALPSWPAATVRWLGRRPARTAAALVLGIMAVAFGAEVATFVATYRSAKYADARAAWGADLRLTPATERMVPPPLPAPGVAALTPVRSIPARVGSDRKAIMAVDPATYPAVSAVAPQMVRGRGLDGLVPDRPGVLLSQEMASALALAPGDTVPVTIFPDDLDLSQKLSLHVVGVYRAFPPTDPVSEMVVDVSLLPAPVPRPDFYLAQAAPGHPVDAVAARLRRGAAGNDYTIDTFAERARGHQRSLTALNLAALSRIEAVGAGLVAAVGVGVLGAFLVIERRGEFAILRAVGADTCHLLAGPVIETGIATVGSLAIGVPVGVGLAILAVRVLGLFFALPPPLVTLPVGALAALAILVVTASAAAVGLAVRSLTGPDVAGLLREP